MKLTRDQIEKLVIRTRLSHSGDDLYGICPQCGEDEFGISLIEDNHPFNCFRKKACGFQGNIYTLLKFLNKGKEYLNEKAPVGNELSTFEDQPVKILDLSLPLVQPPVGWQRLYEDEYLRERGFIDSDFHKYKVGRSRFRRDYVTVLIEMNNVVTGYLSRSVKSKESIDFINKKRKMTGERKYLRYDNSPSEFGRMIFGYDDIVEGKTTDVILTEGWLSKIKTDSNLGLDNDVWLKCGSTFGGKVSPEQIELLKRKRVVNIHLWFEDDILDKKKEVALELSNHFNVRVGMIGIGRDPNDLTPEQSIEILEQSISPMDLNINYI